MHRWLVTAWVLAVTTSAYASDGESARAQALFQEAAQLMSAGDFRHACPKLQESLRLERAPGTLLRLALCHERQGKTATAWAEFLEGKAWAERDGRPDRVRFATEHLLALEPRLSWLTLRVPSEFSELERVSIRLNGSEVRQPAWNSRTPVDPGDVLIQVTADRRLPYEMRLHFKSDGETQEVTLRLPERVAAPGTKRHVRTSALTRAPAQRGIPPLSLALGAGGVAALGVGSYFGGLALRDANVASERCPSSPCADERGVAASTSSIRYAWAANAGLGVGAVALAAGAYFALKSRISPAHRVSIAITPQGGLLGWQVTR